MANYEHSSNMKLINELKKKGVIKTDLVYYTFLSIDRKNFIPQPPYYFDKSSPIGYGAIISAPHMHAYALQYLFSYLTKAKYVLDVGSGTGILTLAMALVSHKECKVYGIQHIPALVQQSIRNIKKENEEILSKIKIIVGDGRKGWIDKKIKFDVIHVGAASQKVPEQLLNQLSENGVMIIPIGKQKSVQEYMKIERINGKLFESILQNVCYVPLTDPQYQKNR